MLVWKTEKLSEYTGRVARGGKLAAFDMTEDIGEELKRRIKIRTPVSKEADQNVPGRLRNSIYRTPVTIGAGGSFRDVTHPLRRAFAVKLVTHVQTDVSYAPYVERNTGKYRRGGRPYIIRPRPGNKAIAFRSRKTGKMVIVAYVKHPGSKGHYMFLKGAASMTERSMEIAAKPALTRWWRDTRSARMT